MREEPVQPIIASYEALEQKRVVDEAAAADAAVDVFLKKNLS